MTWLRRLAWLLSRGPYHGCPPLAPAAASAGFTVADLTVKAGAVTGQQDDTARQAGYPRVIIQIG